MSKIGINVFIRLILLSGIGAIVVFTTSTSKRLRKPCFNYNTKDRHSVIKVKEINKRHWNPCRNSKGLDILQLKENGRNSSIETNLMVCTPPVSLDFVLQFKGTIIRVVSRHGMAEVLTCRHMSDTLIVRANSQMEGNGPSYIAIKVRNSQNINHFGVLSIIDENNHRVRDTYNLELPTYEESRALTREDINQRQSRIKRSLKHTNLIDDSNKNSNYKPTETSECGVSRACFRIGSDSCSHFQCLYYLSYKIIKDKVDIELSGKTSGWIALGFSFNNTWDGSDVLACVRNRKNTHGVRVVAFSGVRNKTHIQKPSLSNLTHSEIHGGYIYCRILLPSGKFSKDGIYVDLNHELYQLYARGHISAENKILPTDDSEISKSEKKISMYNNQMNVLKSPVVKQPSASYQHSFITAQSECGVHRGCFRHGRPSCSHFECLYYLSYKVNTAKDKVDIELSGKTEGWIAVGFSSDNKMGGDDILSCQIVPQKGEVKVMAYSDPLPRQRPDEKPSQAQILHVESRDEFIYCRMEVPITRKPTSERAGYLDLSSEWFQLYAKGRVSQAGNMLQHTEAPMTSSGLLTILRNNVNVHINLSSKMRASSNCLAVAFSFIFLIIFPA